MLKNYTRLTALFFTLTLCCPPAGAQLPPPPQSSVLPATGPVPQPAPLKEAFVSIAEQKIVVLNQGKKVAAFPVSTSKFGVGDRFGSWATPLGVMQVQRKIGSSRPAGTVFHGRQATREILKPDTPGRDPIVSRILWLSGTEQGNHNAFERCIYIHGTAEERLIGKPASYGCIRMKSADVIALFEMLDVGSRITVGKEKVRVGITNLALSRKLQPAAVEPQTFATISVASTREN